MNILIVGVSGFIGNHLYHALLEQGHHLKGCSRNSVSGINWKAFSFQQADEIWEQLLDDVDLVFNAAGIYLESENTTFNDVHNNGPIKLFEVCNKKQIRVIQISAIGAEQQHPVCEFLNSKRKADQFLLKSDIPQVVLYPGIVLGEGGKSTQQLSLLARQYIRLLVFSRKQKLPLVSIYQLTELIVNIINNWPDKNLCKVVIAKPESTESLLRNLRRWMNLNKNTGFEIYLPITFVSLIFKIYPGFSLGVFNRHSIEMLKKYSQAKELQIKIEQSSGEQMYRAIADKTASESLLRSKASGAFIKSGKLTSLFYFNLLTLSFIWIMSGISSLVNIEQSRELINWLGFNVHSGDILILAASIADILLGIGLWFLRFRSLVIYMQIGLMIIYSIIISLYMPLYWLHPFAPLIKNIAMLVLSLYLLMEEKKAYV